MACSPEEHCRLTVQTAVLVGAIRRCQRRSTSVREPLSLRAQEMRNSRVGDAGSEQGHPGDVCSSSGREDVADGDVLDELWIDARSVERRFEDGDEEVFGQGVLEAALSGLVRGGGKGSMVSAARREGEARAKGGDRL